MGKYLYLIGILLGLLSTGCRNATEGQKEIWIANDSSILIKRIFTVENKLQSEQQFEVKSGDTLANGFCKGYFPSGKLENIFFYETGKKANNFYEFHGTGSLKTLGIINGDSIHFNSKGIQQDREPLYSFTRTFDTVVVGSVVPVEHKVVVVYGVETIIESKLFDTVGNVIWEDKVSKRSNGYSVSYFYGDKTIDAPGRYRYATTATYTDSVTKVPLITKTLEFSFVVMKEPRKTQSKK